MPPNLLSANGVTDELAQAVFGKSERGLLVQ